MTSHPVDVLVIGGGPAGSTTALRLAEKGLSVLLADKATFPRDKPCGGGVTPRARRHCPIDLRPVVEAEVGGFELSFRGGRHVERRLTEDAAVWMTQRSRLDALLLDEAAARGVEVRQGARVEVTDSVRVDGVEVGAHVVVGADGANGSSARAWGLGAAIERGVAFEAEVPYAAIPWSPRRDVALIDIGDIPGGYGWLFPKGDHVNVGVGAWGSEGPRIREHWSRLCARVGVPTDSARNARGHRLPMRTRATRLSDDSHLLVGDAAGLVDPISGDGIYECFVSSELAAEAIAARVGGDAHALIAYDAAIDARLSGLHAAGMAVKRVFDLAPRLTWTVATSGFVWATIERLLRGELASPQDATPLRRLPIGLMSVVGSSVARRT